MPEIKKVKKCHLSEYKQWKAAGETDPETGYLTPEVTDNVNLLSTATSGTLTDEELESLQENELNSIVYGTKLFRRQVMDDDEDVYVYTNTSTNAGKLVVEAITITVSTKAWAWSNISAGGMEVLTGTSDPTSGTEGQLGQLYVNTSKFTVWIHCGKPGSFNYWSNIGGSRNFSVQTFQAAGGTTSDYGSQIAIMGQTSGGVGAISIGSGSKAKGAYATAIGPDAIANTNSCVQIYGGTNNTPRTLQIAGDNIYNWDTHTLSVQNLTDGTTTKTMTQVLAGGGGSQKYRHNLMWLYAGLYLAYAKIDTDSNTPFTSGSLKTYLTNLTDNPNNKSIPAYGQYQGSDKILLSVLVSGNSMYYKYLTLEDGALKTYSSTGEPGNLTDTVTPL